MNTTVRVIRTGEVVAKNIAFEQIKKGDQFWASGERHTCDEEAHLSGDASYDGYLLYDTEGESWFPEDLDTSELTPHASSTADHLPTDEKSESSHSCFIAEENNPYPLCKGQNLAVCTECQVRAGWEPKEDWNLLITKHS